MRRVTLVVVPLLWIWLLSFLAANCVAFTVPAGVKCDGGRISHHRRQQQWLSVNKMRIAIGRDGSTRIPALDSNLFARSQSRVRRFPGRRQVRRLLPRSIISTLLGAASVMQLLTRPVHAGTTLFVRPLTIRQPIWRMFGAILTTFLVLVSIRSSRQSQQRQALDATSEWARYANNPAARGRAVIKIGLRLLPYWIRLVIVSREEESKKRSKIRTESGNVFCTELLKLGPLYIKLGQILSCRPNLLSAEWRTAMEQLQDAVPAQSGQEALDLAYNAIGSQTQFDELFSDFNDVPLAAASLGQVHKAVLRNSTQVVAVKLQRPLLKQIYDRDLELMMKIAKMVDALTARRKTKKKKNSGGGGGVGGVEQSWVDIFKDARDILYREIDYQAEADNGVRFCRDFGIDLGGAPTISNSRSLDGEPLPSAAQWLRAPHVYDKLSTPQALIMEYVPSIKITNKEALQAANVTLEDEEYLADCLARAYLRSLCATKWFSTDPHPGNLGVEIRSNNGQQERPRLVMYDFGQACELEEDQAGGILDVIEAIIDLDSDRCVDAFVKMGVLKDNADLAKVRAKVQDNFETGKITVKQKKLKKAGYKFKENPAVMNDDQISNNRTATTVKDTEVMGFFQLPAQYAFVARALTQMDGVGKSLDPDFDFISSAAPFLVEVKGAGNYLKDEWRKGTQNLVKRITSWQNSFV